MVIRALQLAFIILAIAVIYPFAGRETVLFPKDTATPEDVARVKADTETQNHKADKLASIQSTEDEVIVTAPLPREQARTEEDHPFFQNNSAYALSAQLDLSYLAYYAYSEALPPRKPADTVLEALKDIPVGTPIEEIKRASDAFGIDFTFMKSVAKIESDFDPKQRTGSYIGLFQLSNYEFAKYGSGDILNARDNAVAAAYKFAIAAMLFEVNTHKKATISDLYLIHQQGTQGAEEHVNHPDNIAWKSMCATDEGKQKGEKWCKRAIWGNTLPEIKHVWKTVDNLTSAAFVKMWQDQVNRFYARYSEATIN